MTYSSEVLADSPWGWWRFNDSPVPAGPADSGSAALTFRYGRRPTPGASALVGSGKAITGGNPGSVSLDFAIARSTTLPSSLNGANVTVAGWFAVPAGNVSGEFVSIGNGGNGWGFGIGGSTFDNTGRTLILLDEGVAWRATSYSFPAGAATYHIMVVRGASNAFTVYVNGSSVYTGTHGPNTATSMLTIGGGHSDVRALASNFTVDDVAFFASVLSSSRATAHYNGGAGDPAAVAADSPVSWVKFDETTATAELDDTSGNSRTLRQSGTPPTIVSDGAPAGGTHATFSAASSLFESGATVAQPTVVTYEAWVKLAANPSAQVTLVSAGGSDGTGFTSALEILTDGRPRLHLYNGSTDPVTGSTALSLNVWHHVAGSVGAAGAKLRVDKTTVASSGMTSVSSLTSSRPVIHAVNTVPVPASSVALELGEVAIYFSQLSNARTDAHYDASFAVETTVALSAARPSRTASFSLDGVAGTALAATRPSRTAVFSAVTVSPVALSATSPARTAAFAAATVLAATLTALTPARAAAFTLDAVPDLRSVALAGERPPRIAAFGLLADAHLALSATRPSRAAAFGLNSTASLTLGADRASRTAAFGILVDTGAAPLVLAAERPQRNGTFTVQTGAPGDGGITSLAATRPAREATFVGRATIPIVPVPAHLRQYGPAPVVIARALGAPTMTGPHGTQPVYSVSKAATQRTRQQILADGTDITFLRGIRTPDVDYTLLSPLRYGPGTLDLPQLVGGMEPLFADDRAADLAWMWEGAPIEVNLVLDDPAGIDPPQLFMEGVYKGVLVAWDLDGKNVSIELGGEASGRAALRDRQAVIFPRTNDIGHQISDAVKDLGLPVYPSLGTDTGIEVMTTGGVGHLEHIQNLCAQAWTRQGRYWTVMPNAHGAYEVRRKSDTDIHGTVFFDDARTVARIRRDIAEEPNRIFITGVTPQGKRVRFGVYPGLIQGPAPDFPGRLVNGDSGEGVRLLTRRLQQAGLLKLQDVTGGYDVDVVEAVKDLQDDAGLPKTGEVNQQTWDALYDLNTTGLTLIGAHIEPAAQDPRVRRVNRSASGTVIAFNDDYDPSVLPVDRTIDAGVGKTRSQLRQFARTVLEAASTPNWVGDITFHTGALVRGEQSADVVVTPEMVMEAAELIPTMNLIAPRFEGGTQFNVSALQRGDGTVTATVDTRFRDALEVWDIIDRNKESKNDPARRRNMAARSSTISKDSLGEWDEVGGLLGLDIKLERGWNKFPLPGVAAEGQVRKIRIALKTPAEFAYAVFGRNPDLSWLNANIPQPLTVSGTKKWDTLNDELVSDYWMLFSRGTHAEPGGYWPGRKIYKSITGREPNPDYDPETDPDSAEYVEVTTTEASGTLTGKDVDAAGFPYYSEDRTAIWVAVWVGKKNIIEADRIAWPQLEAGV